MSTYSLRTKLPSADAPKDLLQDIETYILRKAGELTSLDETNLRADYHVSIRDSIGEDRVATLADFNLTRFPNDTQAIIFQYWALPTRITVSLGKHDARLDVLISNQNAKEIAYGMRVEMLRLFDQNRNSNGVFHGAARQAIMGIIAFFSFYLARFTFGAHGSRYRLPFFVVGVCAASFVATGLVFKPYCVFPTRRNEKLQYWFRWFVGGAIGFLIFTVGGVFLRKSVLNF
jgi:hypothetical protein